jgi:hypothetical protein
MSTPLDALCGLATDVSAHGWDDPTVARGRCGQACIALREAAQGIGITVGSVRVWSNLGRPMPPYQRGRDLWHPVFEHNAPVYRRTVLDLTARQFDTEVPAPWIVDEAE